MSNERNYEILSSIDQLHAGKGNRSSFKEEKSRGEAEAWVLDEVRKALAGPARDVGEIVSIYGMGGQGKTYLLERIWRRVLDTSNPNAVVLFNSFDSYQTASVEQMLKDIATLFECQGIPCPGFFMTYYAYRSLKSNVGKAAREFQDDVASVSKSDKTTAALRLLDFAAPFIDAVFGACGVQLPLGSMADASVRAAGEGIAEHRKQLTSERWKQIARLQTSSELHGKLAPMLVQDIRSWLDEHPEKRLIVFFDTIERLGGDAGQRGGRYEWVRMLTRTPGSLWIIAGRVKLLWDNVIPLPICLVEMNRDEADSMLKRAGIVDSEVRGKIETLTECLPVYLDLCVQQYERAGESAFDDVDFSGAREGLIDCMLRNTSEDTSNLAYAAAFLEHWDDDLLDEIAGGLDFYVDTSFLNGLSFVASRNGVYEMHEVIADALRRSPGIRTLKGRLYQLVSQFLQQTLGDTEMREDARIKRLVLLSRVQCRLLDAGVPRVAVDEAFSTYMAYAETVWRYGDIDAAMELFSAIAEGFGSDDAPTPEYLCAKLKIGAIETQFYLAGRGKEHHVRAIALADEVLKQAHEHFADDEPLIQSALNDLGVSWARFKQFERALDYQEELYQGIRSKGTDALTADEARFVNNYGSTCQQYADSLAEGDLKTELYESAGEAYRLSLEARRRLFGENSSQALMVQTNLGVLAARLGDFDEARRIVGEARQRYSAAGFDRATPGFLRCDYQLAMFDEAEAEQLEGIDADRARKLAREAIDRHKRVYDVRAEFLSPMSVDARKSASAVSRCEELLRKLEQNQQ